ncbi:UNVERIFIED_CONTAM: hypothetical protein FKN15_045529 [Acipenser sinensis]
MYYLMFTVLLLLHPWVPTGAFNTSIIGGRAAKPHSRPYMASLQIDSHHVCGGFLVREDFVLTAAHCYEDTLTVVLGAHNLKVKEKSQQKIQVKQFYKHKLNSLNKYDFDVMLLKLARNATLNNKVKVIGLPKKNGDAILDTLTVVLGAHNLKVKEKSQQKIQVKQFYKHKLNSLNKYDFDVMLLKLARNATLNNKVKVIGLPKKNGDVPDKTKCTVAGWGKKHATGEAENVLQEVTVVIENRNDCKKVWKKYVNNRMICTNFTGQKGTCQGDSGGPLLCDTKAQGIAAFTGEDCEDRTYPNVYMKIASFIPWINEIME